MRVLIIGNRGSGKTTAGDLIAYWPSSYRLRSVSTSDVLIIKYANHASIPASMIIRNKDQYREQLWSYGRTLQEKDPGCLVKEALIQSAMQDQPLPFDESDVAQRLNGPGITVVTGVRNPDEMEVCRRLRMFNVIVWLQRDDADRGPTDLLDATYADVNVANNGTLEQLRESLLLVIQSHAKPTDASIEGIYP